jgi:hypothetical protein
MVYTLPLTVSAMGVILHTLHDVLKRLNFADLLYVTIHRPYNLKYMQDREFLGDSTFQQ